MIAYQEMYCKEKSMPWGHIRKHRHICRNYDQSQECLQLYPVNVGVHQGSALRPDLFLLVLDELTGGTPWCLMFACHVMLIDQNEGILSARLEE